MGACVVRLVTRNELRTTISVALAVLKPAQQRSIGIAPRSARDDITDDLVDRIMGKPESETVILQPDLVGTTYATVGKWDVDEPHPHPTLRKS